MGLRLNRYRLYTLLLGTDTVYAEFMLAIFSGLVGTWLMFPWCHVLFTGVLVGNHQPSYQPEICGVLLMFSSLTKFRGLYYDTVHLRKLSCMLATFVWWYLGAVIFTSNAPIQNKLSSPLAPNSIIFGAFNALTFIKLSLVRKP
jgi:hypothetical protein